MKYVIYLIIAVIFILSSCSENEFFFSEQNNADTQNTELKNDDWGIKRQWCDDAQTCITPAINCFDDVIIRPPGDDERKSVSQLSRYLTGNPADVKAFFSSGKYKTVFPQLENKPELLKKLQSGKYAAIEIRGNSTYYYLFGKKEELNSKNPEFVIPVRYE